MYVRCQTSIGRLAPPTQRREVVIIIGIFALSSMLHSSFIIRCVWPANCVDRFAGRGVVVSSALLHVVFDIMVGVVFCRADDLNPAGVLCRAQAPLCIVSNVVVHDGQTTECHRDSVCRFDSTLLTSVSSTASSPFSGETVGVKRRPPSSR